MDILNQEMKSYINGLYEEETGIIGNMRKQYGEQYPIIPRETAQFLKTLLKMKKPKKILEIGTCVGFSSILMATLLPDAHITTIDRYEVMIDIAKANFEKYQLTDRITLREGSALEVMQSMDDSFDFVFIDAAKGQYIHFLPEAIRLSTADAVILADNILQHGDIAKPFEEIVKRQRTIYVNMRKFLDEITHRTGLETSILPIGDGVALTVKG